MTLQEISQTKSRFGDLYILARYFYRIGQPIIADSAYDKLHECFVKGNILSEYTNRTYDDDPIPYTLLKEIGKINTVPELGTDSKYYRLLDEEKSLSIDAKKSNAEVLEFVKTNGHKQLVISLKIDGMSTKSVYINKHLELSMSRGRKGNGFDLTKRISDSIPLKLNDDVKELKVFGEAYVSSDYLPVLRNKYDNTSYKTEKSAAISLLRVSHSAEDYKHLHMLAFSADGVPNVSTVSGTLKYLQSHGFKTTPFLVLEPNTIPTNRKLFDKWLLNICDMFYEKTKHIPSDGLVLEINDLNYEAEVKGQYSERNIAIKLAHWSAKLYFGKVTKIMLEQRKTKCSCRAEIEPVVMADKCTATVINLYSPRVMILNNIKPGTVIAFERDSGAINNLVHGDRLKVYEDLYGPIHELLAFKTLQGGNINE